MVGSCIAPQRAQLPDGGGRALAFAPPLGLFWLGFSLIGARTTSAPFCPPPSLLLTTGHDLGRLDSCIAADAPHLG